jgi:sialate O-acetylesterase
MKPHLAFLAVLATITLATPVRAALELPAVFGDHMVLQRGLAVPVWGWADPGAMVTVRFAAKQRTPSADASGFWMTRLDPPEGNVHPQTLEVSCGADMLSINDVLVGDVWICSGQSNMEWSVEASANAKEEVAAADHPQLRLFNVEGHVTSPIPEKDVNGRWMPCSPESVGKFSAVGYYFGRELLARTKVPVGLIGTNWGGTRVEPWTPPAGFRKVPELRELSRQVDAFDPGTEAGKATWDGYLGQVAGWLEASRRSLSDGRPVSAPPRMPGFTQGHEPTAIYNAMVAPLVPFGVRGAIWYQGESNAGEGEAYFHKLRALVEGWRSVWDQGDSFPFYFYVVQLANFQQAQQAPEGGDGFARVRDGQKKVLTLPHTGLAVITDIGDANDIHPRNKQDVGRRLARWALRDVHRQAVEVSGPMFREMKVEGNQVRLLFDHPGGGLTAGRKNGLEPFEALPGAPPKGFAIAGEDRRWHWAEARIDVESILLSSPEVAKPVAVRYAWAGNPDQANLYNMAGLPAVPFRTDDW